MVLLHQAVHRAISRIQIGRVLAKKKGVQLGLVCLVEAEDNCRGQCCICGDVAHCIEISSFKSGYVVRQCTPAPYEPPPGCIDPNYACNCPSCDCEDCSDVEPGDYCYCKCQQPRTKPSVEFEICDVKTVIACWKPGDGLVDGTMKFVSEDGTTALSRFRKRNIQTRRNRKRTFSRRKRRSRRSGCSGSIRFMSTRYCSNICSLFIGLWLWRRS